MLMSSITLCLLPFSSCSAPSVGFYAGSCPAAEIMVKNTVRSASDLDPTIPGKLLRLLFHDCFIEASYTYFTLSYLRQQDSNGHYLYRAVMLPYYFKVMGLRHKIFTFKRKDLNFLKGLGFRHKIFVEISIIYLFYKLLNL